MISKLRARLSGIGLPITDNRVLTYYFIPARASFSEP